MIRKIFFLIIIGCISSAVFAVSSAEELSQILANVHGMQANFVQTVTNNQGKVLQRSSGTMALQRPGKFRWQVSQPFTQLIITNGKRLWIYDPDLEQVTIHSLAKTAGDAPAMLLSQSNVALQQDFVVHKNQSTANSLQWFVLIPKAQDSMFVTIKLGFAENNIAEMRLQDHLGHLTHVQFKNVKFVSQLPAPLFQFNPPKNVDVIDETIAAKR